MLEWNHIPLPGFLRSHDGQLLMPPHCTFQVQRRSCHKNVSHVDFRGDSNTKVKIGLLETLRCFPYSPYKEPD